MKLWIDDIRPAPDGWEWVKCTNDAIYCIKNYDIELISIDHDAGDYYAYGGDFIKVLDFMEENQINNIPIHVHSMNPVGAGNMKFIIHRNNWKEIYEVI